MDRPQHFPLEIDSAVGDGGVSGAADAPAWFDRPRVASAEPGCFDAPHARLSVLLDAGPCVEARPGDLAAGCHLRLTSPRGDALLGLDLAAVSALVAARFGGDPGEDTPVTGRAAARTVAPHLARFADLVREAWEPAGLAFTASAPAETAASEFTATFAWPVAGGALRLSYAPGLAGPAAARPLAKSSALAAFAPVDVRAVLAKPRLALAAVAALAPGSIVPFMAGDGVRLVAGGRTFGQGALVDADGRRGVALRC